jgi:hypothetical protein
VPNWFGGIYGMAPKKKGESVSEFLKRKREERRKRKTRRRWK